MQANTVNELNKICADLEAIAATIRKETDEVTASGDHIAIIKHFDHTRLAVERIKAAREALHDMADYMSRVTIPDVVAAVKERTGEKPPFNIEGVGRVSVAYRFSASIIDKEKGLEWLRGNGHGGLIQETVNSSTLSAFAKDMLENQGIELPPDIFKVGTSPYTSITKK